MSQTLFNKPLGVGIITYFLYTFYTYYTFSLYFIVLGLGLTPNLGLG